MSINLAPTDIAGIDIAARGFSYGGNAFQRRAPDGDLTRTASTIVSLGSPNIGCAIAPATTVTRPAYLGGEGMISLDRAGSLVGTSDVARYVTATCPWAVTTYSLAQQDAQKQLTTTDHSYQIDWLSGFFSWLLDSTGRKANTLTCAAFNRYFFDQDSTGNSNRLAAVWNALPSNQWMQGFTLMTMYMNREAKDTVGNLDKMRNQATNVRTKMVITPRTQATQALALAQRKLDALLRVNIGSMIMNYDPVMISIKATWIRIYSELQSVDNAVTCDLKIPNTTLSNTTLSLAGSFLNYSKYMFNDPSNGLDPVSRTFAQQLLDVIPIDLATISSMNLDDKQKDILANKQAQLDLLLASGSTTDTSNRKWGIAVDPQAWASSVAPRACVNGIISSSSIAVSISSATSTSSAASISTAISTNSAASISSAISTSPTGSISNTQSAPSTSTTASIPASTAVVPTSTVASPTSTTPTPTPTESCHTHYDATLDKFNIYGANWDSTKLDAGGKPGTGEGLLTQLRGCSVITNWGFENLTADASSPWQFHASGETTIWQKPCIELALVSAGAPDGSFCDGST